MTMQRLPPTQPAALKATNPKDALGAMKVPLHLISPVAKAFAALAQYLGATKYGAWNWRSAGIRASVYYAAANRHLDLWFSGEDIDLDDGTPHLANAAACLFILVDAQRAKKFVDDRPPLVPLRPVYDDVVKSMRDIKAKYGHLEPKHWTIDDKV